MPKHPNGLYEADPNDYCGCHWMLIPSVSPLYYCLLSFFDYTIDREKVSFPFFLPLCSCRFLNRSLSHTRSFCYLWWLLYTMYLTLGSQLEALFEVVMAPYWKTYMAKNRLWGLLRWSLLPAFIHTHPSPRMWTGTTSLLSAPALLLCIPCHDVFCWNLNQNTLSFP